MTTALTPAIQADVPAILLAPMEGVTDAPMRALMSEIGGFTFCVTEFLRVSQTIPGPKVFRSHIPEIANGCRTPVGLPVQVQLLGGDPDRLAQAALVAVRAGAKAIDLNFGCPARGVNRHDGGALLLNYPERIRAIVSTVRRALPGAIPVSAKLRLGWDNPEAIHVNAERAAEGGASWLTIHGRTKAQGYRPPAYWLPIGAVRKRLGIPIVANGEIWTLEDIRRCQDETGCRHFMLGRGALAAPTLARAAANELGIPAAASTKPFGRSPAEWLPLLRRFVELSAAIGSLAYTTTRMKQWLRIANHDGRMPWVEGVNRQTNPQEILDHLSGLAAARQSLVHYEPELPSDPAVELPTTVRLKHPPNEVSPLPGVPGRGETVVLYSRCFNNLLARMKSPVPPSPAFTGFVSVRGARTHNLKHADLDIPRDALVVFTGVSGSGKSSLAFGTLYAEAQRRYLESVAPYARRLFHQLGVPEVDAIDGLPPAVALQQQRGAPTTRSSVGSVTTLSNLLRMLYSRAGDYPPGQGILYAESFSPNTPEGACPTCHGLGRVYDATEASMVRDDALSIREGAVAAWPGAWQGQNLRDILTSLGIDLDTPWRKLPKKDRDWILFTDEQPQVPVWPHYSREEVLRAQKRQEPHDYLGTFVGARRHVLETFAKSDSAMMKRRAARFLVSADCSACRGKRLRPEPLSVTFAGLDIGAMSRQPLSKLAALFAPFATGKAKFAADHPEKAEVARRIAEDLEGRLSVLLDLGLGYLTLERSTPTLSPGELQRLRLATQVRSNLFGVVYVLDEPSAGLHPADTEALLRALDRLKAAGNSLFVVEHELDVIRHADWVVDVGPEAGEKGGRILYSGTPEGLRDVPESSTRRYLFADDAAPKRTARQPRGWLKLTGITRNNLHGLDVAFPLGVFTTVTGVSGSGKSSLVSQALVELVSAHLGHEAAVTEDESPELEQTPVAPVGGRIGGGLEAVKRLVVVDQRPIGRTPRSNLATYTGLFDHVRKLFAATKAARARRYGAGRFSFNVAGGRCDTCAGEGFVMVELLFLPSVYTPCPACQGARYNAKTLEIDYHGKSIADVLGLTVEAAWEFFADEPNVRRSLGALREVGLGYLRLGQPATELSGGEAQRIKLATELQRTERGASLYVLDEPTTGLHPSDVEKLLTQLDGLVAGGNTVVVVEHDMQVIARSDWVIDIGPSAGDEGGRVVAAGTPEEVARAAKSRTAPYLARALGRVWT